MFLGCFSDAENPVSEEVEEVDEEASAVSELSGGSGPAVRLVDHGMEVDGNDVFISYSLDIDKPLDYPIIVLIKRVYYSKERHILILEPVEKERGSEMRMCLIEKRKLTSGLFFSAGF